jgi:hypothetical protein
MLSDSPSYLGDFNGVSEPVVKNVTLCGMHDLSDAR